MILLQVVIFVIFESVLAQIMTADAFYYCMIAGLDLIAMSIIAKHRTGVALTICNLYFISLLFCLVSAFVSLSYSQGMIGYSLYETVFSIQHEIALALTMLSLLVAAGGQIIDGIRGMGSSRAVRIFGFISCLGAIA